MLAHTLTKIRAFWLWFSVAAAGAVLFVCIPGSAELKSRVLLHGLCAQTPTHTFLFDGQLLPFDARMTGIYAGTFCTLLYLVLTGKLLYAGSVPWKVIAILGIGAAAMAADGFNSLLTDVRLWHPWQSHNELRLITGYFMGVALGAALGWLCAASLWKMSTQRTAFNSVRSLLMPYAMLLPIFLLVTSGWSWLFIPITMFLMISAWITVSLLILVMIVLMLKLDERTRSLRQLHIPGATAAALALGIMLALASGRMVIERMLGFPTLLL